MNYGNLHGATWLLRLPHVLGTCGLRRSTQCQPDTAQKKKQWRKSKCKCVMVSSNPKGRSTDEIDGILFTYLLLSVCFADCPLPLGQLSPATTRIQGGLYRILKSSRVCPCPRHSGTRGLREAADCQVVCAFVPHCPHEKDTDKDTVIDDASGLHFRYPHLLCFTRICAETVSHCGLICEQLEVIEFGIHWTYCLKRWRYLSILRSRHHRGTRNKVTNRKKRMVTSHREPQGYPDLARRNKQ